MRTKSGRIPASSRRHAAATAATVAALVLVTGCGKAGDGHPSDAAQTSAAVAAPTPSVNPSYGVQFLAEGECAAAEPGQKVVYREVPCDDPKAVAKVIDRADIGFPDPFEATACSDNADFAVNAPVSIAILEDKPVSGEGYACMRNLKAPHPGDPGGGGGPRIEVGDCVHSAARNGSPVSEHASTHRWTPRTLSCPAPGHHALDGWRSVRPAVMPCLARSAASPCTRPASRPHRWGAPGRGPQLGNPSR
ncbi:hypothetical protein GCM10010207_76650 [Streptomyces atratus]|nr:hypothetical protein GCM10010207_76650 [Streptomyces atratus]